MFYPYPKIDVPSDTLIGVVVAFRALLNELASNRCDEERCGCASSRKIGHAKRVLRELDAMLEVAEARQSFERYVKHYCQFVGESAEETLGQSGSGLRVDPVGGLGIEDGKRDPDPGTLTVTYGARSFTVSHVSRATYDAVCTVLHGREIQDPRPPGETDTP